MYTEIGRCYFKNKGSERKILSIMTLRNSYGQMCHIVEDDHCYVLYNQFPENDYATKTFFIFPEAFEALKKLPNPQ